jgi:hypothetical protein
MASTSANKAGQVLRKVASLVLPRFGTTRDDFKFKAPEFASEADIKALRTMISMLSIIDQPISGRETSPPSGTEAELKELKVLSALATVLVMEHEVVAVLGKHGDHGNGGVMEVFACTDSIVDKESKAPTDKSFLDNLIATYNPRFSDPSKVELAIHNQSATFIQKASAVNFKPDLKKKEKGIL